MTLAQARRQVWIRGGLGGLLIILGVVFLLLTGLKSLYHTPAMPFFPDWGTALRRRIDPILQGWPGLAWLWSLIPTWQLPSAAAPTPAWDFLYIVWGVMVWCLIGGLLIGSARGLQSDIRETRRELRRAGWRRSLEGIDTPRETQVTVLHLASGDPWYKRPPYLISSGVLITVVGGLLLHLAKTLLFSNPR